jgi:hypothetical protein
MPTFVIVNSDGLYLKIYHDLGIDWSQTDYNKYTSKYQAKRHLKELDNIPECVKIIPLLTE